MSKMTKEETFVKNFSAKVRRLISKYTDLKKENDELYALVDERDKEIAELKERVSRLENDYNTLKMARIVEVSDADLEETKKRISKMIRDINQCMTLLSEK